VRADAALRDLEATARLALQTAVALVLVATAAAPRAAAAQGQPQEGWPAPEIGIRGGYDNGQRQEVLGALLRIPVVRNGHVELMPSGDVTFLPGLKEYQFDAEAVYLLSGRDGGFYGGGGIGLRNTIPASDLEGGRQTFTTYSVVVGVKFVDLGPLNLLFEYRRVFADEFAVDPQLIVLGLTLPVW